MNPLRAEVSGELLTQERLDALMRWIGERLSAENYHRAVVLAAYQGLSLREYVARRAQQLMHWRRRGK